MYVAQVKGDLLRDFTMYRHGYVCEVCSHFVCIRQHAKISDDDVNRLSSVMRCSARHHTAQLTTPGADQRPHTTLRTVRAALL